MRFLWCLGVLLLLVSCTSSAKKYKKVYRINKNERISRYFVMKEAIVSRDSRRRHISNIPSPRELSNIRYTAKRLDSVRRLFGRPLVITSWYRSKKLNRVVGGSPTSEHLKGLAVDILLDKRHKKREFYKVKKRLKYFDQLIYYPRRGHIHIGFRRDKKLERHKIMVK